MKMMITILCSVPLMASVLITPQDALKATFGASCEVSKKSQLLKKAQAKAIQNRAKAKLESKIVRLYRAEGEKMCGYGILLNRNVRTKKAAVLYILSPSGTLEAAEVVAFKEPMEYLPGDEWMDQFSDVNDSNTLAIGKGVSVITGATMSARTVSEGARLAMAIFDEALKK